MYVMWAVIGGTKKWAYVWKQKLLVQYSRHDTLEVENR